MVDHEGSLDLKEYAMEGRMDLERCCGSLSAVCLVMGDGFAQGHLEMVLAVRDVKTLAAAVL